MYRIGICDDAEGVCVSLKEMILRFAHANHVQMEVMIWRTGEELCHFLEKEGQVDLLFLDIVLFPRAMSQADASGTFGSLSIWRMPRGSRSSSAYCGGCDLFEMSGVEAGNFIRNYLNDRQMQIVYISEYSSYAMELFRVQPLDFLIKPITQEQMNSCLELAVKLIGRNRKIFICQDGRDTFPILVGSSFYLCGAEGDHRVRALQQAVLLFFPYGQPLKQITASGVFHGKELLKHAHIQSLAETPWTGDQRHIILCFPPLSDEVRFIYIEIIVNAYFFKILTSDTHCPGHDPRSFRSVLERDSCETLIPNRYFAIIHVSVI